MKSQCKQWLQFYIKNNATDMLIVQQLKSKFTFSLCVREIPLHSSIETWGDLHELQLYMA